MNYSTYAFNEMDSQQRTTPEQAMRPIPVKLIKRPLIANETLYIPGTAPRDIGHALPLTDPGSHWSQREYVACVKLGIGFACHRYGETSQVFHYHFPEGIGCTSIIVHPTTERGTSMQHIYHEHEFEAGTDWIDACRASMRAAGFKP
jgi:hypothetical protein